MLGHVIIRTLSKRCDDIPGEVLLVGLLVLLLEAGHVVGDVQAEDVLSVDISIELLALGVVAGEPLLGVRDVQTTINSSLQSSEDLDRESTF